MTNIVKLTRGINNVHVDGYTEYNQRYNSHRRNLVTSSSIKPRSLAAVAREGEHRDIKNEDI